MNLRLFVFAAVVLFAAPLSAQRRVDVTVDAEGVRRTGKADPEFQPNVRRVDLDFASGGGGGVAVTLFLTDRIAVEGKVAALVSRLTVRSMGSDFIAVADLGRMQIYPVMVVAQWHMVERGTLRPYLGVGAGRVVLRNIDERGIVGTGASGLHFKDPTGLVLNGGLRLRLSSRWSLSGDARYVPIETQARAVLVGTGRVVDVSVEPLIAGFGLTYHY